MEGNGETYNVQLLGLAKTQLRQRYLEAAAAGKRAPFLAALRQIAARLQKDPLNLGEPLYRLSGMKLFVRQAVIAPVVVNFGVHDEKPLVLVRGFDALSW